MSHATHEIPELDEKGLREFGLITGAITAVLFGLFFPWFFGVTFPIWPWILFGILSAWALLSPLSLKPVYHNWMLIGILLNKVTTPIILGIVYYLVIVPIGVMMRMRGRDPLSRRLDTKLSSYRIRSKSFQKTKMEKPF